MIYDFNIALKKLSVLVEQWSEEELAEGIAICAELVREDLYYRGRLEVLREEKMLRE